MMESTGQKVSSRARAMSGRTSSTMVGSNKLAPRSARRWQPARIEAPAAVASRSRCSQKPIGGGCVIAPQENGGGPCGDRVYQHVENSGGAVSSHKKNT